MTDKPRQQKPNPRADRLAAALRANLRKRKAVGGSADPEQDQHPPRDGD
jgi:hypothetical protein